MRAPPGGDHPAAVRGSFPAPRGGEKSDVAELTLLDNRLNGLWLSCQRLNLEYQDSATWSSLLADFSAFSASCSLATAALLPRFQTRSVTPQHLPLEVSVFTQVPMLLSTRKSDDIQYQLNETKEGLLRAEAQADERRAVVNELEHYKRNLKQQNGCISESLKRLQRASAEAKPYTAESGGGGRAQSQSFMLAKDRESVQAVLAFLNSGTSRESF